MRSGTICTLSIFVTILSVTAPAYIEAAPRYQINKNMNVVPVDKKGNKKVVLITIDDGPGKTDKDLVDTLKKHNAKAIFFINGVRDAHNPGNIKMIYDAGFSIGNHTWNHANLKKEKNKKIIEKEIDDTTALITKVTGASPRFFRPPYGMSSSFVRERIEKNGMIFMNWSGAAKDWEKASQKEGVFDKNVLGGLHNGEIILLHGYPWTAKYLDALLVAIEKEGYTFVDPNDIL